MNYEYFFIYVSSLKDIHWSFDLYSLHIRNKRRLGYKYSYQGIIN